MKKILKSCFILMTLVFISFWMPPKANSESNPTESLGSKAGLELGTYLQQPEQHIGTHEEENSEENDDSSFKEGVHATGSGIKKGAKATGRGFKKAGRSIKNFFSGDKDKK